MTFHLTGHHVEITDALRSHVNTRMEKIQRHADRVTDLHIVLEVERDRHKAEANIMLRGAKLHAEATQSDMYAAIDAMADKLDRLVKKHREKQVDHHNREHNHAAKSMMSAA